MRHRHLLPALLLVLGTWISAAEGMPAGLPHERVVLRDGRQFSGHYDEAQGVLWLDGAGSPRLRVVPDDIVKRTPIVADNGGKQRPPAEKSVPFPTTAPSPESLQQAVAALEKQLTDLDRRMIESREDLAKVNAHFQEWLKVYAKAEKLAQADRGTGMSYENNASYNLTKIRSEILFVREQLARAQEAVARQTERRQELLTSLRNARQALADAKSQTPTPAVTVYTLEAAPHTNLLLEQRIQTLEAELRGMREDNERLRKILEALTAPRPAPQPAAPSQVEAGERLVAVIP
jgi:hypothetical protein